VAAVSGSGSLVIRVPSRVTVPISA